MIRGVAPVRLGTWIAIVVALALATACTTLTFASPAIADVPGVRAILPIGEGGSASLTDLLSFEATGAVPSSFTNQEAPFNGLVADAPHMTDGLIEQDFPASTIGLTTQAASVESPAPGVTIAWDSQGIPYVTGATQDDVMFGAGYAQAQARLFTMDVLRHLGEGTLTSLIGPGTDDSNVLMDQSVLLQSDYDAAERTAQFDQLPAEFGSEGTMAQQAEYAYTAGINARITADKENPTLMPAEYAATGSYPQPWTVADSVAIAAEINEGFDLGGGAEEIDGEILSELRGRLGATKGNDVYNELTFQNSPLSPTTTTQRFNYPEPDRTDPAAVAMPDPDSVKAVDPIVPLGHAAEADDARAQLSGASWVDRLGSSRLGHTGGESFAVLVGGSQSSTGHPIADMGPQLDFFSPELLLDESLQGPGIDVRGAAVPGAAPVPIVGHTNNFSWSVTIGVGEHIDIYALKLCNANGSAPTEGSTSYLYDGQCTPMLQRSEIEKTVTSLDNPAPPQSFQINTLRSIYGPIVATGTVHGQPVAFARADVVYDHLADTGVVLAEISTGAVTSPQSFIKVARQAPFSLNWFYIDSKNIAWTLSGRYPEPPVKTVRRRVHLKHGRTKLVSYTEGPSPTAPIWGTGSWNWPGFSSNATAASGMTDFNEETIPGSQIPHVINPKSGQITNWNNKPAPGWRASDDDYYFGPVQRVTMYRTRLTAALHANHGRIDEAQLVSLVEDADTVDLRGSLELPWLLKVIGSQGGSEAQQLVGILSTWLAAGAHRSDPNGSGYDQYGAAARLMDAWWPLLVPAMFEPVLGSDAYQQATSVTPIDDPPPQDAEAWYYGWYGQVEEDLRDVLSTPRKAPGQFSRIYCGGSVSSNGTLATCRAVLISTLLQAASTVAAAQGTSNPNDWKLPTTCPVPDTGVPDCDEIVFSATGAIETPSVPWQNRPTYQQVVAFGASGG
jgi:acyl-homoserine lactone acylase PvdQ